jgi:hypothetical protein
MNPGATPRRSNRIRLAALAAMIALPALAVPVRGAGAAIIASATGSGQTTVGGELRTFSFTARIDATGAASGTAQVNNRQVGEMFQLDIDCLKAVGNVAIVSGVFTRHTDTHAIGLTGIFAVVDTGEGPGHPPDQITQVFFFEPGELRCTDLEPADAAPFFTSIDAGSVQVR